MSRALAGICSRQECTKGQVEIDVARLIPPEFVQLVAASFTDLCASVALLALLLDLVR